MTADTNTQRILLVEDDEDLAEITRFQLTNGISRFRYAVDVAHSVADARVLLRENAYALILLDIMLPDGEGFAICESVRAESHCPIIFISCIDDSTSVISALRLGADDYMTKPVDYGELSARIDAQIRRSVIYANEQTDGGNVRHFKRFTLDRKRRRALRDGVHIDLTPTEYAILDFFCANRDDLVLYAQLWQGVWGTDSADDLRTLTVHVSNLRKKIDPSRAGVIVTVRNAGYIFSDA